jgi:wyosine [tRNA(Phe)-imidazoG37] synthetase (radical SAM superfamily)
MLLPLQAGILYGPVNSRRYGLSLGINLSPASCKLCSFDCTYCHYGPTERLASHTEDMKSALREIPTYNDVIRAVQEAVQSRMDFDVITFSGNGEPTLHPDFPDLVDGVIYLRDKYRPRDKVVLLSNSTGLSRPEVRDCIARIDLPVFKLDAGTERTFRRINRPPNGVTLEEIVTNLKTAGRIYIQTVLMDGTPSNTEPDEILAYFERIRDIKPRGIHLYTTDRPVADSRISKVDPGWLDEIASQLKIETGVPALAFYEGSGHWN